MLASFGCLDLACIRKVNGTDIKAYENSLNIAFQPAADNTFTNDVRPFITTGAFANVPIIIGTNSEEGRFYAAQDGLDDPATNQTIAQVIATLFPNNVTLQMQIIGLYLPLLSTLYRATAAVYTDAFFLCPAASLVSALADNGYNIWRYYYRGVYPDLQLFPDAGAYHASDIAQVWGTYPSLNTIALSTVEQAAVSRYMQTTWANFAKDPTAGPGWPQWPKVGNLLGLDSLLDMPTTGILADIGGQNPMGMVLNSSAEIDAICPLMSGATSTLGI